MFFDDDDDDDDDDYDDDNVVIVIHVVPSAVISLWSCLAAESLLSCVMCGTSRGVGGTAKDRL